MPYSGFLIPALNYWIPITSGAAGRGNKRFRGGQVVDGVRNITRTGVAVTVVHDVYWEYEFIHEAAKWRGTFGSSKYSPDSATYQHLSAWWSWASRGETFGFAVDSLKTHDTTLDTAAAATDTQLDVVAIAGGGVTFAISDVLLIQSFDDPTVFEYKVVEDLPDSTTVDLHRPLVYAYPAGSLVRHLEYLPKCVLSEPLRNPFVERDGGRGSHLWDFHCKFRTVT